MKTRLLLITAISVLALSAMAPAQARIGKQGNGKQINRNQEKGEDAEMRAGLKDTERAHRLLKQGLPIYEGHRANAIDESQIAIWEIKAGLLFDRINDRNQSANAPKQMSKTQEGTRKDAAKYNKEQLLRSQKVLSEALVYLKRAQEHLRNASTDYGGHRVSAMKSIETAINQTGIALSLHR